MQHIANILKIDGKAAVMPYMDALEEASVQQNIVPFADLIAGLVEAGLKGQMTAKPPYIKG